MENPVLEMRQVCIRYEDETVVNNFNLKVFPGQIVGIAGESGSGKSTALRAAMGLLNEEGHVDSGEIFFDGRDLRQLSAREFQSLRGQGIGMVFQNTAASLCPVRTIGDQFQEMLRQHGRANQKENREEILSLLDSLGFPNGERILASYPFELSGGMNQRVGIALAMILKPKLLLADEPTSALDVTVQAQVMGELMQLRKLYGTSIVIVAHNIGLLYHMTDYLLVMKDGQVAEEGNTKELIANPRSEYTKKLIQSVVQLKRRKRHGSGVGSEKSQQSLQ